MYAVHTYDHDFLRHATPTLHLSRKAQPCRFHIPTQTTKIFFLGAPRVAQGDTFYLWLLLKNGSTPRSFDDALSVSGVEYPTFKEAASAAGFLDDPLLNEAAFALEEAVQSYTTPKQLRRLFVLLVRSDSPVATAFDKFYPHMIEERWKEQHSNVFAQKVELLRDLQRRLVAEGCKHLSHLGIDVPDGFDLTNSHLQRERTKQFFNQKEADIDTVRDALRIFTAEQRQIFDKVLDACRCGRDALFDIRGRAGSGKTVLLNAIGAQSRLDGHLTAPTASTGFAALNQTFGLTFHRTFDVPVADPRDDAVLQSKLAKGKRAELMAHTRTCTIDEISSLHIASFEAAARVDLPRPVPSGSKQGARHGLHSCPHEHDNDGK